MVEDFEAWAIDFNSPEGHGFAGIYWFDPFTETRPWQDGCRYALFRTRREARAELPRVKESHKAATVRRVYVVINRA